MAGVARRFGDLDLAEDAASEAFVVAVERWPRDGVPPNPGAWLTTTATRKAIDRLRRESHRDGKHQAAHLLADDTPHEPTGPVEDDRLRLVFICCHPALATEARVALTLRLLGGLSVAEIAHAFLVPETTMARRITRAKAKIAAERIQFRMPSASDIPERIDAVLAVVYLIFNEGYLASAGDDPVRPGLIDEAIRLGRLLHALLPDDGEVTGLLALMLLADARRPARVSRSGELVTLDEQDRSAWNRTLISEGHALVRERIAAVAAGAEPPGRYQLLAAINAVHTQAPSARDTDWSQIVALYDRLVRLDPSPIVRLNSAIAVAELDGPDVALAEMDRLGEALDGYHAFHAARADLLRRIGRSDGSRAAYDRAIRLAGNPAERAYLTRRRDQLTWDAEAGGFDDAADHGLKDPKVRAAWADLLLPLIDGRGRRVADLGCGTGTLSLLLAEGGGHYVSGVDFSSEMIHRAREKTRATYPKPVFIVADAAEPPLTAGSFDVVLARHVLWAMPDPAAALERWIELLAPDGVLILIEGRWQTGVGLTADECLRLVSDLREDAQLRMLDDPELWGGPTSDERYLIISRR